MEKSKVDHIGHGLSSSTGENKTNSWNPRGTDVSTVSSEMVHSAQKTSFRSDFSSETGQSFYGKRKDPDYSVMTEVGRENHTTKMHDHSKLLKADSASSKESGEVVQLSSVDSTDPVRYQSFNEYTVERKPCLTQLNESSIVFREQELSVTTKSDSISVSSMQSSRHCKFDLNEGMVRNGTELHKIPPISVVAKVGVPMGLPKKPLQFGGELGWKRSGTTSAFHPTVFKNAEREDRCYGNGWIDLNVAATMDSEIPAVETSMDFSSKQPERFLLDLNRQSENVDNHCKPVSSSFDLNDNPMIEDAWKNNHHNQNIENQQLLRKSVAADTATCLGGNVYQSPVEMRRPSYWVDLSSMQGFNHAQPQPILVAAPTAEQLQMVVPSRLYIGKVNNLSPTFYSPNVIPHLNNQHATAIPQISGSVLAAYPGALQFLEGPQGLNPHALANMRPAFFPNGGIPLTENGSRGIGNPELLVPVRNGLFEARERPVEQIALPVSQINYRQMASWN